MGDHPFFREELVYGLVQFPEFPSESVNHGSSNLQFNVQTAKRHFAAPDCGTAGFIPNPDPGAVFTCLSLLPKNKPDRTQIRLCTPTPLF
jgi:hypothetical protein